MDEQEITGAYERLTDAATPPPDVRRQVAGRVARRRRRRTTSAVVAVALVVAGTAGTAAALRDGRAEETDPVAGPTRVTLEIPRGLTCATTDRGSGVPRFAAGPPTAVSDPAALADGLARPGDHRLFDPEGGRVWVVRPDGTAWAVLHLQRLGSGWSWDGTSQMCDPDPVDAEELRCGDDPVVRGTLTQPPLGGSRDEEQATWPWRGPDDLLHAGGPPGDGTVDVAVVPPDDRPQVVLRIERGDDDLWRVVALAACAGAVPGLSTTGADLALVSLPVGHCWVGTLAYAGRDWELRDADQFGWGGGRPDGFRSVGTVTVAGDLLTYTDASGERLELVPADTPGTEVGEGGCA